MKNRFGELLENLINMAEVKHYVMAEYLQYDSSYISKWISGKLLPAEKGKEYVLRRISDCMVEKGSAQGIDRLLEEYNLSDLDELKMAIFDHLMAEYNYVRGLQNSGESDAISEIAYYPTLSLREFIIKMRHPALRRVKKLEVIAACDLNRMATESRMEFVSLNMNTETDDKAFPNVHFSLIIDISNGMDDCIYNTLFLTNMMTKLSNINFSLYASPFASGKVLFTVKNEYMIHGMLKGENQCIGVTACEGEKYVAPFYREMGSFCTKDSRLFLKRETEDLIASQDYIYAIIAPRQRVILGQMAEHMVPPEMLTTIMGRLDAGAETYDADMVENIGRLLANILRQKPYQMMIYESALYQFEIDGKMTFFNQPITLNYEERARVLDYLLQLIHECPNIEIRLIHGRFHADFRKIEPANMYISEASSYLVINNSGQGKSTTFELNQPEVQVMYSNFYDQLWDNQDGMVVKGQDVVDYISHLKLSVELLNSCIVK